MAAKTLDRTAFRTSRALEYFSEPELTMQIGHSKSAWPVALLKELIDNSLDACESSKDCEKPTIAFGVGNDGDSFFVVDNGPGIPAAVIASAIDYGIRVSDKAAYVSPTRGQLGNALKCLWAAPFVATGQPATATIDSRSELRHRITVDVDHIDQKPILRHKTTRGMVKSGTHIKVFWPDVASSLATRGHDAFYRADELPFVYSVFNPHAEFIFRGDCRWPLRIRPSNHEWKKWRPNRPTSAHWYNDEAFINLICAHLSAERAGAKPRHLRDFVAEFDGLAGTKARSAMLANAGLSGALLSDLMVGKKVDKKAVGRLRSAMAAASRQVDPKHLGVIGKEHLINRLLAMGCDESCISYRSAKGVSDGIPFVLEVAMGADTSANSWRRLMVGLNWSPALTCPIPRLYDLCGEMHIESDDPVGLIVHLACPALRFRDRGKAELDLPSDVQNALDQCVSAVASKWKKSKLQAYRANETAIRQIKRTLKASQPRKVPLVEAAFTVMERAYMHASGNNTGPANARQIMYAARPLIMDLTGGRIWETDSYFTQNLLPRFVLEHPELTATWDVVYDARGHLIEPHTGKVVSLGTLGVRQYVGDWLDVYAAGICTPSVKRSNGTNGPANRYRFVLYIEKEGFLPLLEQAKIAERYDIAIMSTKGVSNISSRELVDNLSSRGATVLVLHDFDKAGFTIASTIQSDCMRHKFESQPNVVDIGLRLADVQEMELDAEPVRYKRCKKDPRINLAESGATVEEQDFLVSEKDGAESYAGSRVELNAMTSPQFIEFIERKLAEHGVAKVIPPVETLESAVRAEIRRHYVNDKIKALAEQASEHAEAASVPDNLADLVAKHLERNDSQAWDDAISSIAERFA